MTLRTTEDLRETLFQAMDDVKAKRITVSEARSIADIAEKIINTADLELRYSSMVDRLDKSNQGISPGPILLTKESDQK